MSGSDRHISGILLFAKYFINLISVLGNYPSPPEGENAIELAKVVFAKMRFGAILDFRSPESTLGNREF